MATAVSPSEPKLAKHTVVCHHCGAPCDRPAETVHAHGFDFCCHGCEAVFSLINQHGMCDYYSLKELESHDRLAKPLVSSTTTADLDYLDTEGAKPWLRYSEIKGTATITFQVPGITCASCIYLLNHLHRFEPSVLESSADFGLKQLTIWYQVVGIKPSALAQLISNLGYPPLVQDPALGQQSAKADRTESSRLLARLGVAGFCAGNAMMLSFPAYLGLGPEEVATLGPLIRGLNLIIGAVVVAYSAGPYFTRSFQELKVGRLSVDVPIAMAVAVLFGRSAWELIADSGSGFIDSLSGLVFLLLIGLWMQTRYLEDLSFQHQIGALFPLTAQVMRAGRFMTLPISELLEEDIITLKAGDLLAADGILVKQAHAIWDHSFITGESRPKQEEVGAKLLAGSRLTSGTVSVELTSKASNSYLLSLWNRAARVKTGSGKLTAFTSLFINWFTYITLLVALATYAYWALVAGPMASITWQAVTAVLMVACPCAVTLALPFATHQGVSLLAKMGLHVKHAAVVEHLAQVKHLAFDKTGTLTIPTTGDVTSIKWISSSDTNPALSEFIESLVLQAAELNQHPILQAVAGSMTPPEVRVELTSMYETVGAGLKVSANGQNVLLGKWAFCVGDETLTPKGTHLAISINGEVIGHFEIASALLPGMQQLVAELPASLPLHIITGDEAASLAYLAPIRNIRPDTNFQFSQKPDDKLNKVLIWEKQGEPVMMVGDGLNDAPALQAASVGIALLAERSSFAPAADAVANRKNLVNLPLWLSMSKGTLKAVKIALRLSLVYNLIGVGMAAAGMLTPLFAAAFMPLSSLSVVALAVLITKHKGTSLIKKLHTNP